MSWNKKDDNFYDSPDVISYGLEFDELAIYDLANTYACRHLTDGKVPVRSLIAYPSRGFIDDPESVMAKRWQAINCLLDFGFFANLTDGSVDIVDFLKSHDSKAEVEEKRKRISEVRSEAGRAGGLAKASVAIAKQTLAPVAKQSLAPGAKQNLAPGDKQSLAPHLTDPHHTTPHRGASPGASSLGASDAHTLATAAAAAPAPEPGPEAPAPAAQPVRLVGLVEKIPFGLAGFHADIGAELKGKGLPPDARRAARHMHEMLYFAVEMAKGPIDVTDSSMSDYSFSLRVLEKYELMSRDDLQQAKRLLGSFLAMNERYNQQKGTA